MSIVFFLPSVKKGVLLTVASFPFILRVEYAMATAEKGCRDRLNMFTSVAQRLSDREGRWNRQIEKALFFKLFLDICFHTSFSLESTLITDLNVECQCCRNFVKFIIDHGVSVSIHPVSVFIIVKEL
jgi:hypothetical protein